MISAAAIVAAALKILHYEEHHGHQPHWGDAPTWLTFVAAALGVPFAGYQFYQQRKTLNEEVARQVKRDELLDEQLEQTRAANDALLRQQAEQIDLACDYAASPTEKNDRAAAQREAAEKAKATNTEPPQIPHGRDPLTQVYVAKVSNGSRRPIRNVTCNIEPAENCPTKQADWVSVIYTIDPQDIGRAGKEYQRLATARAGHIQPLIRVDERYAFVFEVKKDDYPGARVSVEFTDDAGNRWRIDHDLSLTDITPSRPPAPQVARPASRRAGPPPVV